MPYRRIAVFGGVYSNYRALAATLEDAGRRDVDGVFCLGDLGGFGPHPDRVYPLLRDAGVQVVRGNYDVSLARGWRTAAAATPTRATTTMPP